MGPTRHLALVLLLAGSLPALADDVRPPTDAEHRTLENFAESNKGCREWTDGCMVCVRHDDGTFRCSLPGIACLPKALVCKGSTFQPEAAPKDGAATDAPKPAPETPPEAAPPKDTPTKETPPKDASPSPDKDAH